MRLPVIHVGRLALGIPEIALILLILGVLIVPTVLFLRTLRTALHLTREHHGRSPNIVWVMLIPVLNVLWGFYLVNVVSNSLNAQLTRRGIERGSAGLVAGMIWNAAGVVGIVVRGKAGDAVFLVSLFAALVYWVQVARLNRLLEASLPPIAN
jgi:hypothetical protein